MYLLCVSIVAPDYGARILIYLLVKISIRSGVFRSKINEVLSLGQFDSMILSMLSLSLSTQSGAQLLCARQTTMDLPGCSRVPYIASVCWFTVLSQLEEVIGLKEKSP